MSQKAARPPLIVYVDVDDTLIRSVGTKRIPIVKVIEHVRNLKEDGAVLYGWSSGGAEYAREVITDLGIGDCFENFLPKPNLMIDDQSVSDWKLCLEVHPQSLQNSNQKDYWSNIFED